MSEIPVYTEKEEKYYNDLISIATKELGLKDSFDFPHEKNDERSRMMWYFLAKDIENNPELIHNYEKAISNWEKEHENEYWINNWKKVIDKVKSGNTQVLFEKNELMQQLRSNSPNANHFLEPKLRKKIIDKISIINSNSDFGNITNARKQKI